MFFPRERVAVFCDGGNFHRGKRRRKDEAINARLAEMNITTVRLRGSLIVGDLGRAADSVVAALEGRRDDGRAGRARVKSE